MGCKQAKRWSGAGAKRLEAEGDRGASGEYARPCVCPVHDPPAHRPKAQHPSASPVPQIST